MYPLDYNKCLSKALILLSKKRYTSGEMRKKLQQYGQKVLKGYRSIEEEGALELDETVFDRVIERLEELRYLDDEQYAKDFVSSRIMFKPKGRFMLMRELRQKGIAEDVSDQAIDEVGLDETEVGTELLVKRMERWQGLPVQKSKEKAMRFLASRGFKPDSIYKIIDSCYNRIS